MNWSVHVINGLAMLGFIMAGLVAHNGTRRPTLIVLGVGVAVGLTVCLVVARLLLRRRPLWVWRPPHWAVRRLRGGRRVA
jgi:hypothetical protein